MIWLFHWLDLRTIHIPPTVISSSSLFFWHKQEWRRRLWNNCDYQPDYTVSHRTKQIRKTYLFSVEIRQKNSIFFSWHLQAYLSSQNDRLWWTLKSFRRKSRNRQETDCSCRLAVTVCVPFGCPCSRELQLKSSTCNILQRHIRH
jgi:Holliday junction resolvase-like predicted endonuclease